MKILNSKKGFTLVEIMIVVILMSVLVAVAVPVYSGISKQKRVDDCYANRIVISTMVKEAMTGMMDNGKKQDSINMSFANPEHVVVSPSNFPAGYASVNCFLLTYDDAKAFTLSDIRGGYRLPSHKDYAAGCKEGYYLKRRDLGDVKFYTYLSNSEIPTCAFETDNTSYQYYIFSDGTVICNCPDCLE
ncbi:MAG: type II secretion system protein [Clostridia bacterium]|nr:type II secretion system protein [Clostridia bacterium]